MRFFRDRWSATPWIVALAVCGVSSGEDELPDVRDCAGVQNCSVAGEARCDGDLLGVCETDPNGCLVITDTTDCRAEPGSNFCDSNASACGFDACLDDPSLPQCGGQCSDECDPAAFPGCVGDTLVRCEMQAGCLTLSTTECTSMGLRCNPATSTCGDAAQGGTCAAASVLTTKSFLWNGTDFNSAAAGTNDFSGPGCLPANGRDMIFAVDLLPNETLIFTEQSDFDAVLHIQETCDVLGACLTSVDGTEQLRYEAMSATRVFAIVEAFSLAPSEPAFVVTIDVVSSVCGDGFVVRSEGCDDGNLIAGDGCSATCEEESNFFCAGEPSDCVAIACGDGIPEANEECDDGNTGNGDGCSSGCTIEPNYACNGAPSNCYVLAPGELCDDPLPLTAGVTVSVDSTVFNNDYGSTCGLGASGADIVYSIPVLAGQTVVVTSTPTDGAFQPSLAIDTSCAAIQIDDCEVSEKRFQSAPLTASWFNDTGAPTTALIVSDGVPRGTYDLVATVTTAVCGDGAVVVPEGCDDNNISGGDGCSASCQVEASYLCSGEPSNCVAAALNDTCQNAQMLTAGSTISASNENSTDDYGSTCGYSGGGGDLVYSLSVPASWVASITVTPTDGTFDPTIAWATNCNDIMANACLVKMDATAPGEVETGVFTNNSGSAVTLYIVIDGYDTLGAFTLAVLVEAPGCGNGIVAAGEGCDDGNTNNGDGCSSTCAVESGWACAGGPSNCALLAGNDQCSGAITVTNGQTLTADNSSASNDYGNSCGSGFSGADLVYTIDVPGGMSLQVNAVPQGQQDVAIAIALACSDVENDGCFLDADVGLDGDPETLNYINPTGNTQSVKVVIDTYGNLGPVVVTFSVQ